VDAIDFFLTVHVEDEPHFDAMLTALVSGVLARSGIGAAAAIDVLASVHRALASGAANGRECCLRFTAQDGRLEVSVGYTGESEKRISVSHP
jgi:hypothetical protein